MMTLGRKRSVLLLVCLASVLLSGCVSKGKYNDLQGQYNDLQGQYKQLQQSSAAQNAAATTEIAALKKERAADRAQVGRLQNAIKYTVNSDLLFRSGSWEMSKEGQEVIAKLAPRLAPLMGLSADTEPGAAGEALTDARGYHPQRSTA